MTTSKKITIIGGTGYAGSAIAREAADRGHKVISVSRSTPTEPIESVTYETSGVQKADASIADADVIIGAFSPRGTNTGSLAKVYSELASKAAKARARLVLVGGFSCLRPVPGAPRMIEAAVFPPEVPAEVVAEAKECYEVLKNMLDDKTGVDWLFISPAMEFSAWQPGRDLGRYRKGDEVALFDENGKSAISGIDYARAVLDEIEHPTRHRAQIGVAY